ncbi:MAG: C4-dicarboxylate ABC transporter substrate-binding protein [Gammaproteobacteria bacterium]|nr:MAG: C4-dicarboxylate ABC transporter substrate-binding protein [Gammaproteobacteria bacterium]
MSAKKLTKLALAAAIATSSVAVAKDEVVLRFSYFWPATSAFHKGAVEPWAKKIEQESNGRLKIQLFPSSTLSKATATYEAAVKGTVDIGSQAQGYTNGRFPLTQIAELPGLSSTATQMGCILQTLYDNGTIASEYEDSHVLFMYGLGPSAIHTADKAVKKPEDLKGLRIRRPSAVAGDLIETLGASPVGMPAGDVYTSLQKGVIDGLSFPWEASKAFRVNEVTKYHTNMPLYTSSLVVNMNKAKYDSLPDDLKKVLDNNSGMEMAKKVGAIYAEYDQAAIDDAVAKGGELIEIPDPLNDPDWGGPLKAGTQKYLDSVTATGKDAEGVYKAAQAASAACKE